MGIDAPWRDKVHRALDTLLLAAENRKVSLVAQTLSSAWEFRRDRMLPAMEAAAAWGSRYVVAWQPAAGVLGPAAAAPSTVPTAGAARATPEAGAARPAASAAVEVDQGLGAPLEQCSAAREHRPGPAAAGTCSCPLPHVQRELALSGLTCASPCCANFGGASDAALALRRCAGCRVATYCR